MFNFIRFSVTARETIARRFTVSAKTISDTSFSRIISNYKVLFTSVFFICDCHNVINVVNYQPAHIETV